MSTLKAPHCVLGNNALRCLHCGVETALPLPISLGVMTAMSEDFTEDHKRCKPSEAGAARFRYATPLEWIHSWDTGVSSIAIYRHMSGLFVNNPAPPQDPSDFGRCYRLLKLMPEWRARIGELARFGVPTSTAAVSGWAPLVEAWDRLEALYEEEISVGAPGAGSTSKDVGTVPGASTGKAPKLYALMSALRANARESGK